MIDAVTAAASAGPGLPACSSPRCRPRGATAAHERSRPKRGGAPLRDSDAEGLQLVGRRVAVTSPQAATPSADGPTQGATAGVRREETFTPRLEGSSELGEPQPLGYGLRRGNQLHGDVHRTTRSAIVTAVEHLPPPPKGGSRSTETPPARRDLLMPPPWDPRNICLAQDVIHAPSERGREKTIHPFRQVERRQPAAHDRPSFGLLCQEPVTAGPYLGPGRTRRATAVGASRYPVNPPPDGRVQ